MCCLTGQTGDTGSTGQIGSTGTSGQTGGTGGTGPLGPMGSTGSTGREGMTGATGQYDTLSSCLVKMSRQNCDHYIQNRHIHDYLYLLYLFNEKHQTIWI